MNDSQGQYVTQESLDNLKNELEKIKNITIPEIAKRIDDAKQQGDLSENAEYHQAREDMSWTKGRMLKIEQIIQNAKIINKKKKNDTVTVGCALTVKINGQNKNYTIVGPQEINPAQGYISNESPLGSAFLGHSVGDKVEVVTPAGKQIYEISSIS